MKMIQYTPPFRTLMRDLFESNDALRTGGFVPALDIEETADAYLVTLELPGIDPKQVELAVEDQVLRISGEKSFSKADESESPRKWYRTERRSGKFRRDIRLANDVDTAGIEATSSHGVLTVRLPRREEAKPKKIEVRIDA